MRAIQLGNLASGTGLLHSQDHIPQFSPAVYIAHGLNDPVQWPDTVYHSPILPKLKKPGHLLDIFTFWRRQGEENPAGTEKNRGEQSPRHRFQTKKTKQTK